MLPSATAPIDSLALFMELVVFHALRDLFREFILIMNIYVRIFLWSVINSETYGLVVCVFLHIEGNTVYYYLKNAIIVWDVDPVKMTQKYLCIYLLSKMQINFQILACET